MPILMYISQCVCMCVLTINGNTKQAGEITIIVDTIISNGRTKGVGKVRPALVAVESSTI